MISRYRFLVDTVEVLSSDRAYIFYSCLLSMLPFEYGELMHSQGDTPVSQFLYYNKEKRENIWQVTVFGADAAAVFCPVLDELSKLELNSGTLNLRLREKLQYSAAEFIASARRHPADRWETLRFLSPTAFKQNGRYVFLPQERLIVKSLLSKWNAVFPEYPLDDEDAVILLENGIHISDYSLTSVRFSLKDNRIPGFKGSITLEAKLAPPIMEIWNLLIHFAGFSGIGIKTALGMGGVKRT